MVISLSAWVLAAICSAVMDLLENKPAFDGSVFSKKNPKWWLKEESWKHVGFLPLTRYRLDGWHLFKSQLVVYATIAIVAYATIINWWVDVLIYGAVWNLVFTLFYHKLLRRRK